MTRPRPRPPLLTQLLPCIGRPLWTGQPGHDLGVITDLLIGSMARCSPASFPTKRDLRFSSENRLKTSASACNFLSLHGQSYIHHNTTTTTTTTPQQTITKSNRYSLPSLRLPVQAEPSSLPVIVCVCVCSTAVVTVAASSAVRPSINSFVARLLSSLPTNTNHPRCSDPIPPEPPCALSSRIPLPPHIIHLPALHWHAMESLLPGI